jgi:5'-3' exonuclease
MDYLSKYIDWYIHSRITDDPRWRNIEVIFSNEKSPGEGEHKIINYIRKYGNPIDRYCVHGLDADLIMLGLGTHLPNFWILREDLYDRRNEYFLLDIGASRNKLSLLMDWNDQNQRNKGKVTFDPESSVNDFIFICFMVGNDFLPHIPSLEIIEGGIDQMLDVYKNVGESYGHLTHTVDDKVIFRKSSLEVFFGTIAQYDKGILEDKLLHKDKFFPDPILENNAKLDKGKYTLDIDGYRKEYYETCIDEGVGIKDLCHQYFEGMQWVLSYYTRGVPDWKWCFKHHYAPFANELAEHIVDFKFPDKRHTEPTTPFQQLLSVLPPKSSALIPVPLSQLLTDFKSEIKKFCPDKFKVDISGKRKEWEGIVLLPMVDFTIIEKEYSKHIDKVSSMDLTRNILGDSFSYKYSLDISEKFRSYYGTIKECKVLETTIYV